jgi:hypothetical protein
MHIKLHCCLSKAFSTVPLLEQGGGGLEGLHADLSSNTVWNDLNTEETKADKDPVSSFKKVLLGGGGGGT